MNYLVVSKYHKLNYLVVRKYHITNNLVVRKCHILLNLVVRKYHIMKEVRYFQFLKAFIQIQSKLCMIYTFFDLKNV